MKLKWKLKAKTSQRQNVGETQRREEKRSGEERRGERDVPSAFNKRIMAQSYHA